MSLSEWWKTVPREEKFVVYGLILAILLAVAYYAIKKIRGETRGDLPTSSDYLGAFRELHTEGTIDKDEFEKLRTTISQQTLDEIGESKPPDSQTPDKQQAATDPKSENESQSTNDDIEQE